MMKTRKGHNVYPITVAQNSFVLCKVLSEYGSTQYRYKPDNRHGA